MVSVADLHIVEESPVVLSGGRRSLSAFQVYKCFIQVNVALYSSPKNADTRD